MTDHWRGLVEACRGKTGRVDSAEYFRWMDMDMMVEYAHQMADA